MSEIIAVAGNAVKLFTGHYTSGFAKTLARPGGNLTGSSDITADVSPKQFELLLEIVPKLSRVGVLINPANSAHAAILKNVRAAAQSVGVKVLPVEAPNPQEIEKAFSTMARESAGALIVANDGLFGQQQRQIVQLAAKHRLPTAYTVAGCVEAGGLMSYGKNLDDNFRRAATYVDKIFKGAKPGDLPIEQAARFELVVNMKTAKALGIKIPNSILVRADRVIE